MARVFSCSGVGMLLLMTVVESRAFLLDIDA